MKINKKNIFILITFLFCFFSISFSKNNNMIIKGYIKSYGNEPFTQIGIETVDKKQYSIKADQTIIDELSVMGGRLIEFKGLIIKEEINDFAFNLKDGTFEVISWKVLK